MGEIRLKSVFDEFIRLWPIVVLFALVGAFTGYLLSKSLPPLYEAKAVLSFGLNYDRDPPLRQREQDLAEGKIAGFVTSDEILRTALDELENLHPSEDQLPSLGTFRSQIQLVRKISRWELSVIDPDPTLAAMLANAWLSSTERGLWEAYTHALRADGLQVQLDQVQAELATLQSNPSSSQENSQSIEDLLVKAEELQTSLQTELDLSHGVVTFVSFEAINQADVPVGAARHDVGSRVFSGGMLGMLIGFLLAYITRLFPKRT